jgi:pyruvate/2-oxoglutarate dehydrogenase complex dihydrolipoamide dehydrogenase (E3) component
MPSSQPEVEQRDVLVLGSGEAGKYIAWTLAASAKKTALIERRYIGGSCPNIACLPSKNVVYSAQIAHLATLAASFGLHPPQPDIDMSVVRERKRSMVDGLVKMHENRFRQSGTELILGAGHFVAPKAIEVTLNGGGTRTLSAEHVIISTGSRATIANVPGLAESQPLTHVEALELGELPEHLIILGGGYVGLEFAQAFRRFGSRVTVVDHNSRLLPREDDDIVETLTQILLNEGVEILTGAQVTQIEGHSGAQVTLHIDRPGGKMQLTGTHILVATGRTPNTDGIGLDQAGVALTSRGFVQVNERLQTTAPGVFAVGDCAGSPHFTHIAFDDFRIVRETLAGRTRVTTGRLVPHASSSSPNWRTLASMNGRPAKKGLAIVSPNCPWKPFCAPAPRARRKVSSRPSSASRTTPSSASPHLGPTPAKPWLPSSSP